MEGPQLTSGFAFQSLSKIGTEMVCEASNEKLMLKSINSSKSAMFMITLASTFFDAFDMSATAQVLESAVLLKYILATFRTPKIQSLSWELDVDGLNLTVTVVAENGIVKTYQLECLGTASFNVPIDKSTYGTKVVAEASEMSKLLSSFQSTMSELTIIANPRTHISEAGRACQLKSFYDPNKGRGGSSLHTSLDIDTQSVFVDYQHGSEEAADVTFNVKDFRAMVVLCEHLSANIAIWFHEPGLPLLVEPHFPGMAAEADFKAELVLATLAESQIVAGPELAQETGQRPQVHHPSMPAPQAQQARAFDQAAQGTRAHLPDRTREDAVSGHAAADNPDKLLHFRHTSHAGSRGAGSMLHTEQGGFEDDDLEEAPFQGDVEESDPDPEQLPGHSPLPSATTRRDAAAGTWQAPRSVQHPVSAQQLGGFMPQAANGQGHLQPCCPALTNLNGLPPAAAVSPAPLRRPDFQELGEPSPVGSALQKRLQEARQSMDTSPGYGAPAYPSHGLHSSLHTGAAEMQAKGRSMQAEAAGAPGVPPAGKQEVSQAGQGVASQAQGWEDEVLPATPSQSDLSGNEGGEGLGPGMLE